MRSDEEPATRVDNLFELLANRRRRAVLTVLRATPRGEIDREALIDAVMSLTDASGDRRAEIETELYHVHLPKLEAVDLVTIDDETVVYDSSPLVERCLDLAKKYENDEWAYRSSSP